MNGGGWAAPQRGREGLNLLPHGVSRVVVDQVSIRGPEHQLERVQGQDERAPAAVPEPQRVRSPFHVGGRMFPALKGELPAGYLL